MAFKGMTMKETSAEVEKNVSKITSAVHDLGETGYSDLAVIVDMPYRTLYTYINKYIKDKSPNIVIESGKNVKSNKSTIKWVDDVKETDKPVKDEKVSNGAHKDPVAERAVNNVMTNFKVACAPGDIWWHNDNPMSMYLILSCYKTTACCLLVKELDNYYDKNVDLSLHFKGDKIYYVSPYRVLSKSVRNFVTKECSMTPEMRDDLLAEVGKYLKIPPVIVEKKVEVPVEKIVEKTVEVPVEKVVEVSVPADEVLQYKAEMWDRFVDKLISSQV